MQAYLDREYQHVYSHASVNNMQGLSPGLLPLDTICEGCGCLQSGDRWPLPTNSTYESNEGAMMNSIFSKAYIGFNSCSSRQEGSRRERMDVILIWRWLGRLGREQLRRKFSKSK